MPRELFNNEYLVRNRKGCVGIGLVVFAVIIGIFMAEYLFWKHVAGGVVLARLEQFAEGKYQLPPYYSTFAKYGELGLLENCSRDKTSLHCYHPSIHKYVKHVYVSMRNIGDNPQIVEVILNCKEDCYKLYGYDVRARLDLKYEDFYPEHHDFGADECMEFDVYIVYSTKLCQSKSYNKYGEINNQFFTGRITLPIFTVIWNPMYWLSVDSTGIAYIVTLNSLNEFYKSFHGNKFVNYKDGKYE